MLTLNRKEGQWVEVIHRSGDRMMIRLSDTTASGARLIFDDDAQNFKIERPERRIRDFSVVNLGPVS